MHVVVAIDNEMFPPALLRFWARRSRDDHGMAFRWHHFGIEADLVAMRHEPRGAGAHVGRVLGLGRDAGEAQVVAQFGEAAFLILFQVVEDGVHLPDA